MEKIKEFKELMEKANKIVFLTGAGISTDSGIPDFRGTNGLWKTKENPESLVTRSFFYSKPKLFWEKYKEFFDLASLDSYVPNQAHKWIADLQKVKEKVVVITQNVDGLHTLAGSKEVYEIHGTLRTATCPKCGTKYDINYLLANEVPRCSPEKSTHKRCELILKPDAVLFGDRVHDFQEALTQALEADLLVVMGTSLKVGPINTLPGTVLKKGIPAVLINQEPTEKDELFTLVLNQPIKKVLSDLKKVIE